MTPRPFVEEILRDLPPGRALDLACGNGRNAVWLAERGWNVTAVDRAPALPPDRLTGLEVRVADLEKHEFAIEPASWDAILKSYYLQPDLFPALLQGLKPAGIAIVIVHLYEPGHESSRFSLHPGQLRAYFAGHDILAYREEKPEGGRLVAQIAVRAIH